jgi:hypothetical protein
MNSTWIVGTVLIMALVVQMTCVHIWLTRRFNQRFPPISDAEFVARCTPGTNQQIALKVRRIVADRLGVEYERIYPSTRFVEDLGAD